MLLFWSRDVAKGRQIAAIRFESLVKLDTIRIVPAGVSPFHALPEELGCATRRLLFSFDTQTLPLIGLPRPLNFFSMPGSTTNLTILVTRRVLLTLSSQCPCHSTV